MNKEYVLVPVEILDWAIKEIDSVIPADTHNAKIRSSIIKMLNGFKDLSRIDPVSQEYVQALEDALKGILECRNSIYDFKQMREKAKAALQLKDKNK